MSRSADLDAECPYCAPTDDDRDAAEQIAANGGNMTAHEIAHSRMFTLVAMCWSLPRANAAMAREHEEGHWVGSHAHRDGTVYVPNKERP